MALDLTPLTNAVTRLREGLARDESDVSDTQIRDALRQTCRRATMYVPPHPASDGRASAE